MSKLFVFQRLIYAFLLLTVVELSAQSSQVTWKQLSEVTFKEEYNKEYDFNVLIPYFSDKIKALDGTVIEVEGYYIPIDEEGYEKSIILSAFPNSQCFFCGISGPESVLEAKVKQVPKNIKLDAKIKIRGKLSLNSRDLSRLNYILENAVLIK